MRTATAAAVKLNDTRDITHNSVVGEANQIMI
jgi:hypothetical protein